ncbi:MAG: hypothetical protein RLO81_09755 [Fulvivirga sp.]|uniref:hypothetical protein n=1 Tax=Fulvivirga sp. TaxID=1931237 RepID=UPI0032EDBDF5
MKKLKYLPILAILFAVTFSSCSDEDFGPLKGDEDDLPIPPPPPPPPDPNQTLVVIDSLSS